MLLGIPDDGNTLLAREATTYIDYYAGYIQDDWRVSSQLVLNMGIRFEHEKGLQEKNNNLTVGFDGPRGLIENVTQDGRDLARRIAGADVFVFPSLTDTFGIVMLEAMACGVPVAAFPVTGPIDVVSPGLSGCLDDDLTAACSRALDLNRHDCRHYAETRTWRRATSQFISNLAPRCGEYGQPLAYP